VHALLLGDAPDKAEDGDVVAQLGREERALELRLGAEVVGRHR
jgi:hypothetical protein